MRKIIGKVSGNYIFNGDQQLAHLSWEQVKNYQKNKNNVLLIQLKELIGKEMLAVGITNVWKAANEGKGLVLVVEKDFECPAFIKTDSNELLPVVSGDKINYSYIQDAVARTIKVVRDKQGKILFVDNGTMNSFNKIALQLRYNGSQH